LLSQDTPLSENAQISDEIPSSDLNEDFLMPEDEIADEGEGLNIFTDEEHGFTITYGPDFESAEVQRHDVSLALRHKHNSYPTFNIITQPGHYPVETRPFADQQREILRSYRQAGMVDAAIQDSSLGQVSNRPALKIALKYSDSRGEYVALLALVSASDRHFFLTLVDEASNYEESWQIFESLTEGFFIHEELSDAPLQERIQAGRTNRYIVLAVTFLLVLGLIVVLIRRRGVNNP